VKKVTLQDLTRELPSAHDQEHYIAYIHAESDRGAALMAAAFVERTLEDQIRLQLDHLDGDITDSWFEGPTAPFRTFAAKIALGSALGLYTRDIQDVLVAIKNVRNTFAHRMLPLDFKNPTIAEECKILAPAEVRDSEKDARHVFATSCLTVIRALGRKRVGYAHVEAVAARRQGGAE
jgi:hypothetical protein